MQSRAASRMTRRRAASRSKVFFCIFLNRYILYIICNTVTKRRNDRRAVSGHSLASVRLAVRDQLVLLQRLREFAHIVRDDFPAGIELSADHSHDVRLRRPGLS